MRILDFEEYNIDEEIHDIIHSYLDDISSIKDYKIKEQRLMEMISLIISKINKIAQEGDIFEVAGNLMSVAYYLEEFDYREAQDIYLTAIKYYKRYLMNLEKSGMFKEAIAISNEIAEIFHNKLSDSESEKKYILKSINYHISILDISNGFSQPRDMVILMYNLSELYLKLEDWENTIEISEKTLEFAKENKYYDIIANLYFNLSDIYLFSGEDDKSIDIFEEASLFFSEEEERLDIKKDSYLLSQIYQILKNFNSALNNAQEFRKYSRKEANAYIQLAKSIYNNSKDHQKVAGFYRGAGLCFKETENDYLEGASCFIIAANIFKKINEFTESGLCYSDSAMLFEELGLFNKAVNLYCLAAECGLKTSNHEFTIEKLMSGLDLAKLKNLTVNKDEIAEKIITNLKILSDLHKGNEKFFMSGTLLLETLPYYALLGHSKRTKVVKNLLKDIAKRYESEIVNNSNEAKSLTINYITCLTAISYTAIKDFERSEEFIKKLSNSDSKTIESYRIIADGILNSYRKGKNFDLSNYDKRVKKLFSNSDEIKLFNEFLFY